MTQTLDELDAVSERVIGAAIQVHRTFGPGLLESVYRACLLIELRHRGLRAEAHRRVVLEYAGESIPTGLTLDVVVEECVVVELKAVDRLLSIYEAQVLTYLKLSGYPAGLLMNFNAITLRDGLKRLDRPDIWASRKARGEKRFGRRDPSTITG